MPHMYLNTGHAAGEECSSTYEGRHLTIEESLITHPSHPVDGLVDGGDPVVVGGADGHIVGVAFTSAALATDYIAIDTEGIWFLNVTALNDAGASAVAEGDEIYINVSTCILSKITDFETQIPFGYALGDLAQSTGVVAIKVHWDPVHWDLYHTNATAVADNGMSITVMDTGTETNDYNRALMLNYTQSGDKTGTAEINVLGADLMLEDDVPYAYNISLYMGASNNPIVGQVAAIAVYMDDLGTAITGRTPIDLGKVCTNGASGRDTFIRMREHGTVLGDSVLLLEGPNNLGCATYFVDLQNGAGNGLPFILAAIGGNQTAKIAVRWNAVDYFIPLHTA